MPGLRLIAHHRRTACLGLLLASVAAVAWLVDVRDGRSVRRHASAVSSHHDRWLTLTGASRWSVPRLSGFDRHRSCPPTLDAPGHCRDAADLELDSSRQLARLGAMVRSTARAEPTTAAFHTLGLFELSLRRHDSAIDALSRAAALAPTSAAVASDLAAAYWLRANADDEPVDWLRSLEHADRAIELDRTSRAARWNRALALDALHLNEAASEAYEAIRRQDEAGWAPEASTRAAPLQTRSSVVGSQDIDALATLSDEALRSRIAHDPQAVRDHLRDVTLPRWASNPTVDSLEGVERLASTVADVTGDREILDAVHLIARTPAPQRRELARLHQRFAEARELYLDQRRAESAALWPALEHDLRRVGSPFAEWAAYHGALCAYGLGLTDDSLRRLRALKASLDPERRPALIGQIEWMIGLIHVTVGRPGSAIGPYERAIEALESVRALGAAAFLRMLLGDAQSRLGDHRAAWRHVHAALGSAHHIHDARWLRAVYAKPTDLVEALGHAPTAIYFSDLAVAHARRSEGSNVVAEALVQRAELLQRLGRSTAARDDLAAARARLDDLTDEAVRAEVEVQILVAEIAVFEMAASADHRRRLDAAIEHARRNRRDIFLPTLYAHRASLHEPESRDARIADLERAADSIEAQRESLGPLRWRLSFDAFHRQTLEDLLVARLERGDPVDELLLLNERLHDVTRRADPEGSTRRRAEMPDRVATIAYAVLGDRLLGWMVQRGTPSLVEIDVARSTLERAARIAGDPTRPAWRSERARMQLFDWLLAPFSAELDDLDAVAVTPDGPLGRVPFGLLVDRETGAAAHDRWLVALTLSPRSMKTPQPAALAASVDVPRLLAVGDPAFSKTHYPTLRRLPGATHEATAVARSYPIHEVLIGDRAGRDALLTALDAADRFHYAGHAIVVPDVPERTRLVLAESASNEPSDLDVGTIRALPLDRLELAVLSGCETAIGSRRDGRGTSSLAGAFLHAGVDSVIATWTPLDDAASAAFFAQLHARLAAGEPPAHAVAMLQRTYLRAQRPTDPMPWVGIHVVTATWSSLAAGPS